MMVRALVSFLVNLLLEKGGEEELFSCRLSEHAIQKGAIHNFNIYYLCVKHDILLTGPLIHHMTVKLEDCRAGL